MKALLPVFILILLSCAEGKSNIERIAGGRKAKKGQFPFFAQLWFEIQLNETLVLPMMCGASLILPEWILSAGHCFKPPPSFNFSKMFVLMGSNLKFVNDTNNDFDANTVKHFIIHENYTEVNVTLPGSTMQVTGGHNDIAVAKLQRPYAMYKYVRVAYLPPPNLGKFTTRCKVGTIVGTGLIKPVDSGKLEFDTHVLYAVVKSRTKNELFTELPLYIPNKFYSEVKWLHGQPFEGDSGGPFVCYENRKPVIYGLVSSGYPMSNYNTGVSEYERVDTQMRFIMNTIPSARIIDPHKPDVAITAKSSHTAVVSTYCFSVSVFLIMHLK